MSNTVFSVATITSARDNHLYNLIRGIEQSSILPDELVIVYMNQPNELTIKTSLRVRSFHINADSLPLASARNECAQRAKNEQIIFLDVDCIPASTMFEELLSCSAINDSLVMATPHYLHKDVELKNFDDAYLNCHSVIHKNRSTIKTGFSDNYTLFWSLCFAVTKSTFKAIGGFDTSFVGYGGEDTDFALSTQQTGIALYISNASCYHQYHAVYKPPVQHVDDIVINSNYFFKKWGVWPMTSWLAAFVDLKYIQWNSNSHAPITVIRLPTILEQLAFKDTHNPY